MRLRFWAKLDGGRVLWFNGQYCSGSFRHSTCGGVRGQEYLGCYSDSTALAIHATCDEYDSIDECMAGSNPIRRASVMLSHSGCVNATSSVGHGSLQHVPDGVASVRFHEEQYCAGTGVEARCTCSTPACHSRVMGCYVGQGAVQNM